MAEQSKIYAKALIKLLSILNHNTLMIVLNAQVKDQKDPNFAANLLTLTSIQYRFENLADLLIDDKKVKDELLKHS